MSRPRRLPTSPDHEQHDPLLVAQFAARDPLDPVQQEEAAALVANCAVCAALAADLPSVSAAVAWEPVPPRRRDFRISAQQAEQLRGGLVDRLMRRLALPSFGSLRPAAAGVMSLGLLMVVVGTALPADEIRVQPAEPMAAPQAADEDAQVPATELVAPFDDAADPALVTEAETSASEARSMITDPPGLDGDAGNVSQKAARDRDVEASSAAREVSEFAADVASGAALAEGADESASQAEESLNQVDALDRIEEQGEQSPDPAGALSLDTAASASPEPAGSPTGALGRADPLGIDGATTANLDNGIQVSTMLLIVGSLLAVGGAALLVLMWLARRSRDPLLH